MSHGVTPSVVVTSSLRVLVSAVLLTVALLALPGAAIANHSTASGWYHLNPLPAGDRPYSDVSMVGEEAWVAADAPFLLHSADGGRTFQPLVPTDGSGYFDLVDFVSSSTGFACRYRSGIYRTMDGGLTWALVQSIPLATFDDLCVLDATHAWVQVSNADEEGQYRTTNGTTWTKTTPPRRLADVAFTDSLSGWAVGNTYPIGGTNQRTATSMIYKTTDGGATWNLWRTTTDQELLCVAVLSASRVLFGGAYVGPFNDFDGASGQIPRVVVMTSGTSFATVALPGTDTEVVDLAFSDANRGWASLSDQTDWTLETDPSAIATTANGGDAWSVVEQPGEAALDCNAAGTVLATGGAGYAYNGLTQRGWSYSVLRASGGGLFQRTDYSGISRDLPIGDLSFADVDHGWALHAWSVSRTQNGGALWRTQQVMTESQTRGLNAIAASSASTVWVVGSYGIMYKSADGGASWTAVDPGTSLTLVDVAFGDATHGWAVGNASLQRTTNGGQTWLPISPDVKYTWDGVAAPSATRAFFTGRDSTAARDCVVRTMDAGSSWEAVLIAGAGVDLKGVWFRTADDGWAYGSKGALYHTTDGGAGWSPAGFGSVFTAEELPMVVATDVVFETATKGWAICDLPDGGPVIGWALLATTDGGVTWTDVTRSTGASTGDDLFAAASLGGRTWLGGQNGTLIADFNADVAAPVTTSSYDGRWTNQPVAIALSASDAGAGVAYSRYRYKTAPWAYGDTFDVPAPSNHSNDGAWLFQYCSTDVLGQAEAAKSQLVKIDTRIPQGAVVESSPALVATSYVGPAFSLRWSGFDYGTPVALAAEGSVNAVDVVGDVAYVLDGTLLRVVSVAKPMSPAQLGAVDLEVEATDVKVVGGFAYVAAPAVGLIVVDVAEAHRPVVAGVGRVDGVASQVAVTNGVAYVAAGAGGVALVDVRDPGAPAPFAAIRADDAIDVAAEGDLLCLVADGFVATYNIERPDRPAELGTEGFKETPRAVAMSGQIACVAAGTTQYVLGLGGAGRPEVLDVYASAYDCSDVAIDGVLIHLVSQFGILALDATAPDWTVFAGAIDLPIQPPVALDADGDYAYIADGTGGLQIMKAMPIEAASYVLDVDGQVTGPDNTPEPDARSASFAGVSGGVKYFRVKTRDQAGNWNVHVNFPVTVDATAPSLGSNADTGWHQNFTVTISSSDGQSGLSGTEYRVDSGSWTAGTSVSLGTWKRGGNNGPHTVDGRGHRSCGERHADVVDRQAGPSRSR